MGSNTEKKPGTNLKNIYRNYTKIFLIYYKSSMKLFSIASCKVITLNLFRLKFVISCVLLFYTVLSTYCYHSFNYLNEWSCCSLLTSISFPLQFAFEQERVINITVKLVGRAISIWSAIQKKKRNKHKTNNALIHSIFLIFKIGRTFFHGIHRRIF